LLGRGQHEQRHKHKPHRGLSEKVAEGYLP
jgi:hypothetical protein